MGQHDVLIVGAGHAGAQAAISLRQAGFHGSITMFGQEAHFPYERPPLSKEYMAGEKVFDRLHLRPEKFWADKDIAVALNSEVIEVNPAMKTVTLRDGRKASYGKLIWAAGGEPRRLQCKGADLSGIHAIRTKNDVDRIVADLDGELKRVGIVGGGFIGLEAAAVLSKLGHKVTLLEALPRILGRVAGEQISEFYMQEHRNFGVDIRVNANVASLSGDEGRISHICLANGESIATDLMIVGIGIEPQVKALADAGAECVNGVRVDRYCQTTLPDIYAVGDCAEHENSFADDAFIRLESVQNANDMAATAAKHICGGTQPYSALPWFWSNQFDLKLQTAGLSVDHDQTVVRGEPSERSFSVIYLKDEKVIALDCVNAMKDYVQGRKLVEARAEIAGKLLSDTSKPLKEMM